IQSFFFFSSRRRHTRFSRDWSSDVCSSDLTAIASATTMMQEQLERESTRLRQLQQRNPYVRPSEIEAVKQRRGLLLEAFAQPLLQLDAARIIINIHE